MISRRRIIGSQRAPFECCPNEQVAKQDADQERRAFEPRHHTSNQTKLQTRPKPPPKPDEPEAEEDEQDYGELESDVEREHVLRGRQVWCGRKCAAGDKEAPKFGAAPTRRRADEMALSSGADLRETRGDQQQELAYNRHFDPYSVYGEDDDEEDVWYSEQRVFEVS